MITCSIMVCFHIVCVTELVTFCLGAWLAHLYCKCPFVRCINLCVCVHFYAVTVRQSHQNYLHSISYRVIHASLTFHQPWGVCVCACALFVMVQIYACDSPDLNGIKEEHVYVMLVFMGVHIVVYIHSNRVWHWTFWWYPRP